MPQKPASWNSKRTLAVEDAVVHTAEGVVVHTAAGDAVVHSTEGVVVHTAAGDAVVHSAVGMW